MPGTVRWVSANSRTLSKQPFPASWTVHVIVDNRHTQIAVPPPLAGPIPEVSHALHTNQRLLVCTKLKEE